MPISARGNIRLLSIFLLLAGMLPVSVAAQSNAAKPYILGVFPHLPPRELEKVFAPMAADISKAIGHPIVFRSTTTYEKFAQQLDKQEFDIAFVQPFDYVRAADKHGYLPVATRSQRLSALLVVTPDSPLIESKSLRGKRIALPPQTAAVSQLVKSHLLESGLIPGTDVHISYYRSHVSCMQQVLIGSADACGTAAPAVRYFEKRMKVKMKTIIKTRDIPHTLFAVHSRIPQTVREQIQQRIIGWASTDEGKILLKRGSLKPFIAIHDSDYDVVRQMSSQ